jgi:hypothetical protein
MKKGIRTIVKSMSDAHSSSNRHTVLFAIQRAKDYAKILNLSFYKILELWEENRGYNRQNYYNEANFPALDEDTVIVSCAEKLKELYSSYTCSYCDSIVKSPIWCDLCKFTTDGLFRNLGRGKVLVVTIDCRPRYIFEPVRGNLT